MPTIKSFSRLMLGLFIFGLALAMMLKAEIGIPPWDVLGQGISKTFGISFGQATIVVSALVLLAWIPLKVKPGLGSIMNALCIGLFVDLWLPYVPSFENYFAKLLMFLLGICTVAFATGLYISAKLGSGPRDGLMIGTQKALGWPLWLVRTIYEGTVLIVGFLLGGQVREGTLIFAVTIGYLMQAAMKFFKVQK
ncbi:MAG: hypothetical protein RL612_926 [Actinomycetota bacterium]|jgi:uncharacterized membrane protein YczE